MKYFNVLSNMLNELSWYLLFLTHHLFFFSSNMAFLYQYTQIEQQGVLNSIPELLPNHLMLLQETL